MTAHDEAREPATRPLPAVPPGTPLTRWPAATKATRALADRAARTLAEAGYPDAASPGRDPMQPAFTVDADPLGVTVADVGPGQPTTATLERFAAALHRAGMRPVLAGGDLLLQSPKPVLWNGKRVRARALQTRLWAALIGLLGVGLIAGLYYALWQMHWTFGPLHIDWSLKAFWDAGSFWPKGIGHWPDYRHGGFRDQLEPAIATVVILSALAGPKLWAMHVGPVNLAARLVLLLVAGVVLGCLGVYLRDFGLPTAWARAHGPDWTGWFAWAGRLSLFTLAWGALMGFVLHTLWGPAGATIQGYWVDRLADRGRARGRVPLYVRLPLAPPVIRERYSWLYMRPAITLAQPGRANRWLFASITLFVVLTIALGITAKYVIAHGTTIPYLAPGH